MPSIADIQDKKEAEILQKYPSTSQPQHDHVVQRSEAHAARILQRTYRGHRERRQLQGLSLDPTSRWTEVRSWSDYTGPTAFPSLADSLDRRSKKLSIKT